jgi:hypothetical protein
MKLSLFWGDGLWGGQNENKIKGLIDLYKEAEITD